MSYWFSWFITATLVSAATSILNIVVLVYSEVVVHMDLLMLWVFYMLFNCSLIMLAFLASVFITRAKLAGPIYAVITVGIAICGIFVAVRNEIPTGVKVLLSLFSPVAFTIGNVHIMENSKVGLGWNDLSEGSPSLLTCSGMMVLDIFLYCFLTWYADKVTPSEFGTVQPFYFPFLPSYWFPSNNQSEKGVLLKKTSSTYGTHVASSFDSHDEDADVEEVSSLLGTPYVSIRDLRKEYDNGTVAVDKLNLDLYDDQITALLGHNGAGKSTTIHILTGLIPPTSGRLHQYPKVIYEIVRANRFECGRRRHYWRIQLKLAHAPH